MKRIRPFRNLFVIVLLFALCAFFFPAGRAVASDKPNFIFIIVDDLGATDIACGGDGNCLDSTYYRTPHIARLRSQSMRFTNAYVDSQFCKPTRASILTGKCNKRLKISNLPGRLGLYETTVAEALDAAGTDYLCASVGKWGLSKQPVQSTPKDAFPGRQGFDYNYGGSGKLDPKEKKEGHFELRDGIAGWDPCEYPGLNDPDPCEPNEFLADSITTRAIEFLQTAKDSSKPFFLYLAYYSVHEPIQAKQQDINDVNDWTPDDDPPPKGDSNRTYAAMLNNLDDNIGRVIEAIDSNHLDLDVDTIIIFCGDDGGEGLYTSNRPLHGDKGSLYEGGIRVPLIIKWPGHTDDGLTCHKPVSSIDFFPTILDIAYGQGYAAARYPLIDGLSLVDLLYDSGNPDFTRDTLCWYNLGPGPTQCAVREGDYKLISLIDQELQIYYELYKLYDEQGNNITECPTADPGCNPNEPNDPDCFDCPCANSLYTDDPNNPNYIKSQDLRGKLDDWLNTFKPYKQSDPNFRWKYIKDAMTDANLSDGDTLILPPAVFLECINITKQVTIRSEDPNDPSIVAATVIDGTGKTFPTVRISDDNCALEGVTVTRAKACSQNGAAIQSDGRTAKITKCIIRDNYSEQSGGAIYNVGGEISNCIIINNWADGNGGAIVDCNAVIKNCIISGNSATNSGGGLYNCTGDIIENTIVSNTARNGGLSDCNNMTIKNCIIWSNEPNQLCNCSTPGYCCITGCSGGTNNINTDPNFINCFRSIDKTAGPGLYDTIIVADACGYNVSDIIEYDNDGTVRTITDVNFLTGIITFIPQRAFTSDSNIVICNWGPGVNNVNEDYHINSLSPCIDAGDPNTSTAKCETDIDAEPRIINGNDDTDEVIDMGADEFYWSPADFDRDETVNFIDYTLLADVWLADDPNISLDDDNDVDIDDLGLFCIDWLWQLGMSRGLVDTFYRMSYQQPVLLIEQCSEPAAAQVQVDVNDLLDWLDGVWQDGELPDLTCEEYLDFRQTIEESDDY